MNLLSMRTVAECHAVK